VLDAVESERAVLYSLGDGGPIAILSQRLIRSEHEA
jgi:hypothetical protein